MIPRIATSFLRRAKRHVSENDRYRLYPLYSCLLAILLYVIVYWPFDVSVIHALVAHRWILIIDRWAWNAVLTLSFAFGILGLLRPAWPARIISMVGLYLAMQWLIAPFWGPIETVLSFVMSYAFERPAHLIERAAGAGTSAAAMLWSIYLLLVWIAIRPLARRAYRRVYSLEALIIERWPIAKKLAKPLL